MKSKIYFSEKLENKKRKSAAARFYYPAEIVLKNGTTKKALFTSNELMSAIERANKNPENFPVSSDSFWRRYFGWF